MNMQMDRSLGPNKVLAKLQRAREDYRRHHYPWRITVIDADGNASEPECIGGMTDAQLRVVQILRPTFQVREHRERLGEVAIKLLQHAKASPVRFPFDAVDGKPTRVLRVEYTRKG